MIAWIGIRPLAINWPPERRAADANGAAHLFSIDEHAGCASWLHRGGEMFDVLRGQQFRQLSLECLQLSELADIGELHRLHDTILRPW